MKQLRMISLFSGAGGLDYGFEAAGFETCAAVEMDHDCCDTLRASRDWPVIEKNIHKVASTEMLEVSGLRVGEVALLVGGPPCQPFSKSGYWAVGDTRRLEDSRADTLGAYMRCVEDMLPEVFVLENVHGISYSGKEEGFRLLERTTAEINHRRGTNYQLSWKVINMADHGVPQLRKRFFLVAQREGRKFEFPTPTHGQLESRDALQPSLDQPVLKPYATAWDAIGDLDEREVDLKPKGRWADLLPSIPEGENYLWHTNRRGGVPLFGWRTRYWSFLLKLAKNKPSWTIQAQPGPAIGPFHWRSRPLSVEEMARLQTFPEDVQFIGGRTSVQRQIGNAVPSLMSEILGREIAEQLLGVSVPGPLRFAVESRRPIPPAELTQPVPDKYLALAGDHPDHPGEGKGRLYINRAIS